MNLLTPNPSQKSGYWNHFHHRYLLFSHRLALLSLHVLHPKELKVGFAGVLQHGYHDPWKKKKKIFLNGGKKSFSHSSAVGDLRTVPSSLKLSLQPCAGAWGRTHLCAHCSIWGLSCTGLQMAHLSHLLLIGTLISIQGRRDVNVSQGIALGIGACRLGVLGEVASSPPSLLCERRGVVSFALRFCSCQSGM